MMFGDGTWGRSSPSCSRGRNALSLAKTAQDTQDVKETQAELVARINAQAPDFFTSFPSAVRSGDHLRVSAALDRASDEAQATFEAMKAESEADFAASGAPAPNGAANPGRLGQHPGRLAAGGQRGASLSSGHGRYGNRHVFCR